MSFTIFTFAAPSYGSSPAKGLFRFCAKSSQARTANENTSAGREYRPGTNTSGAKNKKKRDSEVEKNQKKIRSVRSERLGVRERERERQRERERERERERSEERRVGKEC